MITLTVKALQDNFEYFVDKVVDGEEILITDDNGTIMAKMVAYE